MSVEQQPVVLVPNCAEASQPESALAAVTNRLKQQIDLLFKLVNRQNVCLKRTNRFRNYLKTFVTGNNIDTEKFNCEFGKYEQNYSLCWKRCRKLNRKLLGGQPTSTNNNKALYDTLGDLIQSLTVSDAAPTNVVCEPELICLPKPESTSSLSYECQLRCCKKREHSNNVNQNESITTNCSKPVTRKKRSTNGDDCKKTTISNNQAKVPRRSRIKTELGVELSKSTKKVTTTDSSTSTAGDDIGAGTTTDQIRLKLKRRRFLDKRVDCYFEGCTYVAKLPCLLAKHMLVHSEKREFRCQAEGCDFAAKKISILTQHQFANGHEPSFKCEQCGNEYKSVGLLNTHLKTHRTERLRCEYEGCSASYKEKKDLNKHVRIVHTKELQPLCCDWPDCKFTAFRPKQLREHRNIHTGERPYKCFWPDCDKSFKTSSGLSAHKLMHKNERRYKCQWPGCSYSCNLLGNLQKHEAIHEQKKQKQMLIR